MTEPGASTSTRGPRRIVGWSVAGGTLVVAALLVGFGVGADPAAEDASADGKGFVAGDGTWELLMVDERTEPVDLEGPSTDGSSIDIADWRGDVIVVNVWYAGCAPCRAEAPDLVAVANERADDGLRFIGINSEDTLSTAVAFEETFAVPYPSILDAGDGRAVLALRGVIPPSAVPSTLILDRDGRPAARIVGRLEPDVLRGLIDDVSGATAAGPTDDVPGADESDEP